jgi:hypothetical protein
MERYAGRERVGEREKMGMVRCFGGRGREKGDLPGDWICREVVDMKCVLDVGMRVAVVDARVDVSPSSLYFEEWVERSLWRGTCSYMEMAVVVAVILYEEIGQY